MLTVTRACLVALLAVGVAHAQAPATQPAPSLAKSLGLMIFPAKGQAADVQAADEAYCMGWAKEQTGIDPTAPAPAPAAAPAPPPQAAQQSGGAVKGAARGAIAGTAIGAVAGDTGKGAAIGATAGALGGIRQQKAANEAAEKQAKQQAQQQQQAAQQGADAAQQARTDQFKKAAAVCLEGKGYTVK